MREESQERTKDERGFTFGGGVGEGVPFWGGEEWEEKRRRDVLVSVRRNGAGSAAERGKRPKRRAFKDLERMAQEARRYGDRAKGVGEVFDERW